MLHNINIIYMYHPYNIGLKKNLNVYFTGNNYYPINILSIK